jgi:hypothetical protein
LSISIEGRQRLGLKERLACPSLGRNQEEYGTKKAKKYPRRSLNGLVSQVREKMSKAENENPQCEPPATTRAMRASKNVLLSKDIPDPKAVSWCFVHVLAQVRLEAVV